MLVTVPGCDVDRIQLGRRDRPGTHREVALCACSARAADAGRRGARIGAARSSRRPRCRASSEAAKPPRATLVPVSPDTVSAEELVLACAPRRATLDVGGGLGRRADLLLAGWQRLRDAVEHRGERVHGAAHALGELDDLLLVAHLGHLAQRRRLALDLAACNAAASSAAASAPRVTAAEAMTTPTTASGDEDRGGDQRRRARTAAGWGVRGGLRPAGSRRGRRCCRAFFTLRLARAAER